MRRHLTFFLSALMLASCNVAELNDNNQEAREYGMVFYAGFEERQDTKTFLNETGSLRWTADDRLSIFVGKTYNQQYAYNGETGANKGSFTKVDNPEFVSGNRLDNNIAVYPYSIDNSIEDDGTIHISLPATQTYAENSFGINANTMVAATEDREDNFLLFKNICGYLRVSLYGNAKIASISLNGNNGEKIAGSANVVARYNQLPSLTMSQTATDTIAIDCREGVQLGSDAETATVFYFVVPETDFNNGITIRATAKDGSVFEKSTEKRVAVSRNKISKMPAIEFVSGPSPEARDLSADGTANCYIVSEYGPCKFDATKKGHTSETVGAIASAEVLWESFGNDVQPQVGDVISDVSVKDGIVSFTASGDDGNAVIAVKDAAGTILWSWHIWVCQGFDPTATAQVYYNNAGTVMDRNLGATSAARGDVRALGLLYQWGRKDPFLSGQSISSSTQAKSTISWPSPVSSDASNGTIDYVVKHPMTFVMYNSSNWDWYYTGNRSTDNNRWNSAKGMYDPCPRGWRVPDGGDNGLWSKALGSSSIFGGGPWDSTSKGMDFTGRFSASSEVWYPASGCLRSSGGTLGSVGSYGYFWSCTPDGYNAYYLDFGVNGYLYPLSSDGRAYGQSVRCAKESAPKPAVPEPEMVDLGLSVKWASFNLGATKPEEYGDYYAWGATETWYEAGYAQENPQQHWKEGKSDGYSWVNTPYQTENTTLYYFTRWSKYLEESSYETDIIDSKKILDFEDDAAQVNIAGNWRIPTDAEWTELRENCTWIWTDDYNGTGVSGKIVRSNKSGYTEKSIFLPAAGYRNNGKLYNIGSEGDYWSSSHGTGNTHLAHYVFFNSNSHDWFEGDRCRGKSVRPVSSPKVGESEDINYENW